jgi:hypothetical protein
MRIPQSIIAPILVGLILLSRISSDERASAPVSAQFIPLIPSPVNRPELAHGSLTASSPVPAPLRRLAEAAPPPRLLLTEDLILALDEGRSLEEMRPVILSLYPELKPDFQPNWMGQHSNQIRAAAHRYRLRLELIDVVLSEYAGLSISDSDSE